MVNFRRKAKIFYMHYSTLVNIGLIALICVSLYFGYLTFFIMPNPYVHSAHEYDGRVKFAGGNEKQLERPHADNSNKNVVVPAQSRGLQIDGIAFKLDSKPFRVMSGSIHYFRVPRPYWRNRLRMLKYAGLNTVETYVAWNLHQPLPDKFDFKGQQDIVKFVQLAAAENLHVIIRPGPYICAEWDLGGLPAWLLTDPNMKVRSTYKGYMLAVESYMRKLFDLLAPYQYSLGGPIIAFQIENEYGSFGIDQEYLTRLRDLYLNCSITEFLFTSDGDKMSNLRNGSVPGALATINFQDNPDENFNMLESFQPHKPLMVTEFWTGWFDHWADSVHHVYPTGNYSATLERIFARNASFNLYMFHGGTNFGFMNGANFRWNEIDPSNATYLPTTTGYDYDAPLNESGGITPKLEATRRLIKKYASSFTQFGPKPKILLLDDGQQQQKEENANSENVELTWTHHLTLTDALYATKPMGTVGQPKFVEEVCEEIGGYCIPPYYGFIVYRTNLKEVKNYDKFTLSINGELGDRMQIIVDGRLIVLNTQTNETAVYCRKFEEKVVFHVDVPKLDKDDNCCKDLILLVENMGRVNYGKIAGHFDKQRKGFKGTVKFNNETLNEWVVYDFSLQEKFVNHLNSANGWRLANNKKLSNDASQQFQPAFYRFNFTYQQVAPKYDLFVNYEEWTKGAMFINGFNLGRYWNIGPQLSLYLPGPYISKKEENTMILFELHKPGTMLTMRNYPTYKV